MPINQIKKLYFLHDKQLTGIKESQSEAITISTQKLSCVKTVISHSVSTDTNWLRMADATPEFSQHFSRIIFKFYWEKLKRKEQFNKET
jgi:hypothetical protein